MAGVAAGTFWSIKHSELTTNVKMLHRRSSYDLFFELSKIELPDDQEWGFDAEKLPNKQWLIDVLNKLAPGHRFFKISAKSDSFVPKVQFPLE